MSTTITDIAKQLRLSKSTVSKALNGYDDISPATRERVMKMASSLGYQPSAAARSLSRGRTEKIGLFLNTTIDYVVDYLSGIMPDGVRRANEFGKYLLIYTIIENDAAKLLQVCRGGDIDGIILFSTHYDNHTIETLLHDQFPFVVMGRRILDERVSYVVPDYYDGAYQLTQYLIGLGHQRIAFTTRPQLGITNTEHLNGYLDALATAGIAPDPDLIVETEIIPNSAVQPTKYLLSLSNRPTAICMFHDLLAMEAIKVCKEHGLRIPEDIAITGFDGLRIGQMTSPPLTTVQQPFDYIGKRVVEIVNEQIECTNKLPIQEMVPVELVIREST